MSLRFLLDTNTVSERFRPAPNAAVMDRMRQHVGEMAIAAPVWHELLFGCFRLPPSRRRTQFEQLLFEVLQPTIPILPYDGDAASWHARERARRFQQPPPFIDEQIAAVAHVHDLALVTANVSDFIGFEGLRVENSAEEQRFSKCARAAASAFVGRCPILRSGEDGHQSGVESSPRAERRGGEW